MPDNNSSPAQSRLTAFFSSRPLGTQLSMLVASAFIVMLLSVSLGTSLLIDRSLKIGFIENGENMARLLAEQVALSVLIGTPDGAEQDSAVILSFPGVEQVAVYEGEGVLLSQSGEQLPWFIPVVKSDLSNGVVLEYESADRWQFISPVYSRDEASELGDLESGRQTREEIGQVRLMISKDELYQGRRNIIIGNIVVLLVVSLLLILALNQLSRRLMKPVERFAGIMAEGARGEKLNLRVDLSGSEETRTMGESFNQMMQELEDRESQLAAARDQAVDAANLKSEFAANVSHEIRTPLNGILGTLNLLRDTETNAEQKDLIELAGSSSESLMILINDILDFSRLSLDQATLLRVEFDLYQLLEELTFLHAQSADAANLDVMMMYDQALPRLVQSDPNKIRQLMNNFISNAVKFTDHGFIMVSASKELDSQGKLWIRLSVRDSGIGIDEKDQRAIFQPYAQSDGSMSRKYSGTGLGLSISEKLAEVLHGDIGVTSEPGAGSDFYARIPFNYSDISPYKPHASYPWHGETIYLYAASKEVGEACGNVCQLHGLQPQQFNSIDRLRQALPVVNTSADADFDEGHGKLPLVLFAFAAKSAGKAVCVERALRDIPARVIVVSKQAVGIAESSHLVTVRTPLRASVLETALYKLSGIDLTTNSLKSAEQWTTGSGSFTVLLVEDNAVNQKVAKAMLEKLGASVCLAEDGSEALSRIQERAFDIVLMDCQMPNMNGYDAARAIRQGSCNSSAPIIAMTANVGQQDRAHCFDAGMNDFLGKPFRLEDLVGIMRKWLPATTAVGQSRSGVNTIP